MWPSPFLMQGIYHLQYKHPAMHLAMVIYVMYILQSAESSSICYIASCYFCLECFMSPFNQKCMLVIDFWLELLFSLQYVTGPDKVVLSTQNTSIYIMAPIPYYECAKFNWIPYGMLHIWWIFMTTLIKNKSYYVLKSHTWVKLERFS